MAAEKAAQQRRNVEAEEVAAAKLRVLVPEFKALTAQIKALRDAESDRLQEIKDRRARIDASRSAIAELEAKAAFLRGREETLSTKLGQKKEPVATEAVLREEEQALGLLEKDMVLLEEDISRVEGETLALRAKVANLSVSAEALQSRVSELTDRYMTQSER